MEWKKQSKIIHLNQFRPTSEKHLIENCKALEIIIRSCRGQCIVLDNFYKHLRCCKLHKHRGLLGIQKKYNTYIRTFFAPICTVVDHTFLLFNTNKERRNEQGYRNLQIDSVHFSASQYLGLASRLLPRFILTVETIASELL